MATPQGSVSAAGPSVRSVATAIPQQQQRQQSSVVASPASGKSLGVVFTTNLVIGLPALYVSLVPVGWPTAGQLNS